MKHQLEFYSADVRPTEEMDGMDVIVYNPCDGWHTGEVMAFREGDECDVGLYSSPGNEFTPHSFYTAWAILPDPELLDAAFPRVWR
ncbi:hypothetical protein RGO69_001193 [Morganella morganii]|nr:hypothetical protein [Morganella morganii]